MRYFTYVLPAGLSMIAACATPQMVSAPAPDDVGTLKRRAFAVVKEGIRFRDNPVVRIEAIEAMEAGDREANRPWIRTALLDPHPAVRFAACVALGRAGDQGAVDSIRPLVRDPDENVQLAALFALHLLGTRDASSRMPTYLFGQDDVMVRRNAAMLLGMTDEQSAVRILARAMRDSDPGVRQQALEGMARLGNREARQELVFMTNSGVGSEEVFAINALAGLRDPGMAETFRRKLQSATHLETRLAAARGLGLLGRGDGYAQAMEALTRNIELRADPDDPEPDQRLRIRQLAAGALGAIGNPDALPRLEGALSREEDPRVQVALAKAILEIPVRRVGEAGWTGG